MYLLFCGLVAHNERVGHTSAASSPPEWKAVHRFAPLTVRQIVGQCLHILTSLLGVSCKYLHLKYTDEMNYNIGRFQMMLHRIQRPTR